MACMKANPGGQIDLMEVVGRDRIIELIWETLLAELKSTGALHDRERLLDLLRLIEQDHYLCRNADGYYQFQFALLQRWWKLSRGL